MKKWKARINQLTGIAGVHYAVSMFSRAGLVALPTVRNLAAYDIIVASRDGRKHANIQVKTAPSKVGFWPMRPSRKIKAGPNDYYVFLRWLDKEIRFEGFMVSGRAAKKQVRSWEKSGRRGWPSFHVRGKWAKKGQQWAENWRRLEAVKEGKQVRFVVGVFPGRFSL